MKEELKRRLNILNNHRVPEITQMGLRGGMQDRLKRQELLRHGEKINKQKTKIKNKLSKIEREMEDIGAFPAQSPEPLDDFDEPVFKRIRTRRGFFDL